MIILLLFACKISKIPNPTPVGKSNIPASQLSGTVPSNAIVLPDFVATNSDGESRNTKHILGHPAVLWFYPMTGTPG